MIQKFKKLKIFNTLRVIYEGEDLDAIILQRSYSYVTVVSPRPLDLQTKGFELNKKDVAVIDIREGLEKIMQNFKDTTRNEIRQTFKIDNLYFEILQSPSQSDFEETYNLYSDFEKGQGRKPWKKEKFKELGIVRAKLKNSLIAGVFFYDLKPTLLVAQIFSTRILTDDKDVQRIISKSTRRLVYELCSYGVNNGYTKVNLSSVNFSTKQKANVAQFKMFFNPKIETEYTYIRRPWFMV
ncbi:MAG TPA: hypothetical protein VJI73_03385 [Candidatus Paceibacterota bacterium]